MTVERGPESDGPVAEPNPARMPLPLDPAEYDLQDAAGTIGSVPRRWRWTVEDLEEIPGAALVALEAMVDVLESAGGAGSDLDSLAAGVSAGLIEAASLHGATTGLLEALGANHPLTIATEECDRLLSLAGRAVALEHGTPRRGRPPAEGALSGELVRVSTSGGGVPKSEVEAAEVGPRGLVGDHQATRRHHGRPFQAVCLYSLEVIRALAAEGHPIGPGAVGENLTLSGLDWALVRPGQRIAVGATDPRVVLEVSAFAPPCRSIANAFGDRDFSRIDHDLHPGWARAYAWVLRGGRVRAGEPVVLVP